MLCYGQRRDNPLPICAIYARVSTDHQGDSVEHQISLMTAYAQTQGPDWVIDERFIYRDDGKSGTSIVRREAVKRLIADARKGLFDVVLFKGISRFSRDIVDAVNMLRALRSARVRVISYEESYDSEQGDNDLIFQIHASVAEHEAKKIGIRTKLGHREAAKRGRWPKGVPPYGYMIDPKTKKLVPHPDQAPIIKQIFDMYVNKGVGMVTIAHYLNEHGIKTSTNRMWTQATLRPILTNEVYLGRIVYGKRRREKEFDPETSQSKAKIRLNDEDDIIRVDGTHPALIDEQTFHLAQQIIKSRRKGKAGGALYLLSGILRCSVCGDSMIAHVSYKTRVNGERIKTLRYACIRRRTLGSSVCNGREVLARIVEPLVLQQIRDELNSVEFTQLRSVIMSNLKQESNDEELLESVTRQIEDIEAQIVNANMKNAKGIIDDKTLSLMLRRLNDDKDKLEDLRLDLLARMRDNKENEKEVDAFIRAVRRFKKLDKINDENRSEANFILRQLVEYIVLDDDNHPIIEFKFNIANNQPVTEGI
jgi:site-specific DNA recombinase